MTHKDISRRKFIGTSINWVVTGGIVSSMLNCASTKPPVTSLKDLEKITKESTTPPFTSSECLEKITKEYNVTLEDEFNFEELRDILEVLDQYKSRIGDLKRYGFGIGKSDFDKTYYNARVKYYPELEGHKIAGYRARSSCWPLYQQIEIAPRDVLNDWNNFEIKNRLVPKGEEGRIHDFKASLRHEIAHALAFKLYSRAMHESGWVPSDDDPIFLKEWYKLTEEIRSKAESLKHDDKTNFAENKRPEGYPTRASIFSREHEAFADCVEYVISGAIYANHDKWLMKRIALINKELDRIRDEQPPLNLYKPR